jgi:glyoxylase I family protein
MSAIEVKDVSPLMSVWDMPTTVRFYRDLLGFEIEARSPTYAVEAGEELFHFCRLRSGDAIIMLNTEYDEGQRPSHRPRDDQNRFETSFYYSCPDIDGAYSELQAGGVACSPPGTASFGFRTLNLRDPDGRSITLQWPI